MNKATKVIYDLSGDIDFPDDAPAGARGIDLDNGKVYRNDPETEGQAL